MTMKPCTLTSQHKPRQRHLIRVIHQIVPLLPRNIQDRNNQDKSQNQTSLSLTAVDDPIQLARDIRQLYSSDAMYINKIERKHRDACDVLLQLAKARSHLETKMWPQAVDVSFTISADLHFLISPNLSTIFKIQN